MNDDYKKKKALTSLYSVIADHTNSGFFLQVFQFAFSVAANGTIYLQAVSNISVSKSLEHWEQIVAGIKNNFTYKQCLKIWKMVLNNTH